MPSLTLLIPAVLGLLAGVALVVYVALTRSTATSRAFVRAAATVAVWTLCWNIAAFAPDEAVKFYFAQLRVAAAGWMALAILSLARWLTGPWGQLPRPWAVGLMLIPFLTTVLALTSPYHGLLLEGLAVDRETGFVTGRFGPWHYVGQAFLWTMLIATEFLFVRAALRSPRAGALAAWALPVALLPNMAVALLINTGVLPLHGYSLQPIVYLFAAVIFAHAVLRRRILDPRARFAVVDLIEDVVLVLDAEGHLRDVNRAGQRTLFAGKTPALGQPVAGLLPELSPLIDRAKQGEVVGGHLPLAAARGRTFDIRVVRLREDRAEGFAFVMRDATEQHRAGAELQLRVARLEDLDRLKDNLLATVSHELRTPLNSVLGHADALLDEDLPPAARRYATTLRASGETLLALVNDILDLNKAKSGNMAVDLGPFSPAELLAAVVQPFSVESQRRGLSLTWSMEPASCVLLSDAGLIRRVLMNLVSNAVKYTDRGSVRIDAHFADGVLKVRVADTGIGIAPEDQARVFDEFVQVHPKTAGRVGGTGLGLPIVRRLTALLGGAVRLESTPGKGSTFTLTLPLVESHLPEASAQENSDVSGLMAAPNEAEVPRRRILIVDDVPENVALAEAFLKRARVDVDAASDGAAGLEAFKAQRYDAVFLDIEMPVMNGLEAVRLMRAYEREQRHPRTPIVAMTAHRASDFLSDAQSTGFDEALFRPVRKGEFLQAVARLTASPTTATGPIVRGDALDWRIEELRRRYLRSLATSFHQLRAWLAVADYQAVVDFGHKLKGTAGSFELPELAALGAELEDAAKGDQAKLYVLVEHLGRVLATNLESSRRRGLERSRASEELDEDTQP